MALGNIIARRLVPRARCHHFFFCISSSISRPNCSPPAYLLSCHFSLAFRRTLTIPPYCSLPHYTARFTPLRCFSSQNLYDPVDFIKNPEGISQSLDSGLLQLVEGVKACSAEEEAMAFLDSSVVEPEGPFAFSAIWALRDDWKKALWVFKWCEKQGFPCDKAWDLMIWVLGNHRKFNVAWSLIRDLLKVPRDAGGGRELLIMIDRYAAANYPTKAIKTFETIEKFRMCPDVKAFYTLLDSLCRHEFIEEAEEYMLLNKKLFPVQTESFNIILNGWCNISVDIFEAKRVWKAMSEHCITPDADSYMHMISCFSKVGNLFDSLRLYDEMKKKGWVPSLGVYNSLIFVLTRENCLKEALKILEKLKMTGLQADSTTYNNMIGPLCESKKVEEARVILATMTADNISPTLETYQAFLKGTSFEGTIELLDRMMEAGCGPTEDTFLFLLGKFLDLKQARHALTIWVEMRRYHVTPSFEHYGVVVRGLAMCGLFNKARDIHAEMISNGFTDDPKLKILLNRKLQKRKGKRDRRSIHPN